MLNRLDSSLGFQSQALLLRAERQRIIAGNIANANTVGSKVSRAEFSAVVASAIGPSGGGGAAGANAGIKSAGVTDFEKFGLFGIDATQQEIQAIINGDPQKSSISLGGGKVHGRTLVDMTVGLLAGETVEKDQFMPITVIDRFYTAAFLVMNHAK